MCKHVCFGKAESLTGWEMGSYDVLGSGERASLSASALAV